VTYPHQTHSDFHSASLPLVSEGILDQKMAKRPKVVPLSEEEQKLVTEVRGEESAQKVLVRTDPKTVTLKPDFHLVQEKILNMKLRKDDVWIVTSPKCGTTWTQEITWLVMNKADITTAKAKALTERSPFLWNTVPMFWLNTEDGAENPFLPKGWVAETEDDVADGLFVSLDLVPSPRLIKTHLPFELLPENLLETCKVIFVARNVKDAAVSFFHHEKLLKVHDLIDMSFERYATEIYRPGLTVLGGYFEMLESGWKRQSHPNLRLFWFEAMKKDPKRVIAEIAQHTGYSLSEKELESIEEYTRFDNLKKTCAMNKPSPIYHENRGDFLRKGKVGDWANHFSPDLAAQWDDWAQQELDRIGVTDPDVRGFFGL